MVNLSREISILILDKLVQTFPYLGIDINEQNKISIDIETILNNYDITSRSTALTLCDIPQKAHIFLECKRLEGMALSTIYNYRLVFKKMIKYFNQPLFSITTMDLRLFISNEYIGNMPTSLNDKINKLKSFFKWLHSEGHIPMDPTVNLKPTKEPYRKRKPIDDTDMIKMKEMCTNSRDKALIEFLDSSGLRVSEVSLSKISDVDWNRNCITVIGKGDKQRVAKFSSRANYLLMQYINERQEKGILSQYLFVASKAPHSNLGRRSLERDVKRIADIAGVSSNVFCHRFRTTYISKSVNRGVSIPVVQKLVGHSNPNTTDKYLTLTDEHVNHEYSKIYS